MKRILSSLPAILVCLFLNQTSVMASSHREAPLIANDPLADNTDLYAFRSPCNTDNVVLIANYIPFEHPAGGPNWITFGENIRYEIHVDNNPSTPIDDIVYRFVFTHVNQDASTFFNIRLGKENIKTTYTLTKSVGGGAFTTIITNGVVPPNNIGPRSIQSGVGLGAANYETLITNSVANATGGGGEKVFCGPADDPFFVDLGGAFDVGGFRKNGRDGVAKSNCHSIAIEVPISTLQKTGRAVSTASNILDGDFVIGVYASAYRKEMTTLSNMGAEPTASGNWIQVSRLGMPLTNEAVIPLGMKDKWNATLPSGDGAFIPYFSNPELGLYMDDSQFGGAVPGLADLRIQSNSLGGGVPGAGFDFRNGKPGLFPLKGSPALAGTALDDAIFGTILLPNNTSPRAVDILPIFYTGVPNLAPYQLATGKGGNPLAAGKPFINNFLPTLGDYLRLNMAVPVTPRNSPDFNSLGIVYAAVLGLTDARFNTNTNIEMIPNMDGFPNGRRLEDDVTTIELQAVSGVALAAIGLWYDDYTGGDNPVTPMLGKVLGFNAGVTHNDTTFKACFPYVQAPWAGFTGAQYAGDAPCGLPTDRLYVDASLATSGSGAGWACGLKELSEAIAIANTNPAITSIWVADGTYKPGTPQQGRYNRFNITRANLNILGGFAGGETMASQANPSLNATILSGDVGVEGDMSDNAYQIIRIPSLPANQGALVIDGFIVEKGNANGPGDGNGGAGLYAYSVPTSTPIMVKRTTFRNNMATGNGAAVNLNGVTIMFDGCKFMTNSATAGGGAVYTYGSNSTFVTTLFTGNTTTNGGGAYYGNIGTVTFNKTIFNGNTAAYGGAVYQNRLNVNYTNSLFNANNVTQQGGGLFVHNYSVANITNSTFFKNNATNNGGSVLLNNGGTTNVANSIFWWNTINGAASKYADVGDFGGGANTYANNILQAGSAIPMDNGGTVRNNLRGANPLFVNEMNVLGADMMWGTADDGLALTMGSPARNTGDNALNTQAMDITNSPRVVCTTVDRGAYERQGDCGPVAEIDDTNVFVAAKATASNDNGAVTNPFNNDLQIRYMGTEKAGITVVSASGKTMSVVGNVKEGITHIDASSWSAGIYQAFITTASGKRMNFKVVKL